MELYNQSISGGTTETILARLENEDFDDGIHPNAIGHEKIFKQVKDFLLANKWI